MPDEEASREADEGARPAGLVTRRKLRIGGDLMIVSALGYVPRRRGARHYADAFSRALVIAKDGAHFGGQFAHDQAPALAEIVPACDLLCCPPSSRASSGRFYLARELTVAVGRLLGVPIARPLRWAQATGEAAKAIRYQGGQGRKLGRRVEVLEDVTGLRVCVIDDLCTTGMTAAAVVEALIEAGAAEVFVRTLARTERTEDRPAAERAMVAARGQLRECKRRARRAVEAGAKGR